MNPELSLDDLWNASSSSNRVFQPDQLLHLPGSARRYLNHAIAPGTPLASAVRLQMHGEIKLRGWLPFTAEQVIRLDQGDHGDQGMIWKATTRMYGIPISGSDRMVDGAGAMRWKLLGIFPVMVASGPDITRSAIGRVQVESIWLPSTLCRSDVIWTDTDDRHPHARFKMEGEATKLDLTIEDSGRVRTVSLSRWGNPEGAAFHYVNFGSLVEEEATFDGHTIPTRVRVGWYFGENRFESEGEFFRATVDHATYR